MRSIPLVALPLTLAALTLAACDSEATAIGEEEAGQRPDIDCGDDEATIEEGREVDCVPTDPNTGTQYDTTVAITGFDGDQWNFGIEVAPEPK
ncbi:hypothetical protein K3N28_09550 [Glycomyces sp. TRM65418]|uniref:hypothetical protein n=1 Tax=Glycomyces sp. TRM65418 TaxID=2867006 RepID=UPI001CE53EF9|nr:hypothetical protein [Glycomyces sp. TRM65418]MCC3763315.1 hypothetical protein [Glycomyces sp. TRM65418]QZD57312.1 hypothetical protein K3N28_09490 [Glycomyces sp. TRM65418]